MDELGQIDVAAIGHDRPVCSCAIYDMKYGETMQYW